MPCDREKSPATRRLHPYSPPSTNTLSSSQSTSSSSAPNIGGSPTEAFLHLRYDDLKGLDRKNARKINNQEIARLVVALAGEPPAVSNTPHHMGHPVTCPRICVGGTNYTKMGLYYIRCATNGRSCTAAMKYFGTPLSEATIFNHDELTPRLLIREELRVVHRARSLQSRWTIPITIASSPLYPAAVAKYYGGHQGLTPQAPTLASASNPATNIDADSDIEVLDSYTISSPASMSRESSWTPPPLPFALRLPPQHTDQSSTSAPASIRAPLIVVCFMFWVESHSRYIEVLLFVPHGQTFHLQDFQEVLHGKGIDLTRHLMAYDPIDERWVSFEAAASIGPLFVDYKTYLIRYAEVKGLVGIASACGLAFSSGRLPGSKGKGKVN